MKTKFGKLLAFASILAMTLVSCGPKDEPQDDPQKGDFKLSETSLTMTVGDTKEITAEVDGKVTFKSSSDAIVSITSSNNKATLKANKAGVATITAECDGKKATCKVVVNAKPVDPIDLPVFKGSNYILVWAGETAIAQIADKIALNLTTDDVTNFVYPWLGNFDAAAVDGANAFGAVGEGEAWTANNTWGGLGYNIGDVEGLNKIQELIGDDYDKWVFTAYMKADKSFSFNLNIFGQDGEDGAQSIYMELPGDGKWHEYNYNLGDLELLEFGDYTEPANLITITSWNVKGSQNSDNWTTGATFTTCFYGFYKLPE